MHYIAKMNYRKIALKILFYSLGVAALSGVLAIILPHSGDVIGRLIGTAICTAFVSILLLFSINRLEVQKTRLFGASVGLFTCAIYLSTLGLIWVEFITSSLGFRVRAEDEFGFTALILAGCGSLISLGLLGYYYKKLRIAGLMFSGIWSISLVLWLPVIWGISDPALTLLIENIVYPLQSHVLIIFLCFIRISRVRMAIGGAVAMAGCLASQIVMIKTDGQFDENEFWFLATLLLTGIALILGIKNIIQFRNRENAIRWAELATISIVSISVVLLAMNVYIGVSREPIPDLLVRFSVGTTILSSSAIIALLVWQVLRASAFTSYDGNGMPGICPRCTTEIQIPNGKSECSICGLRMKLQIESPNCRKCGYDITKTPDVSKCQECGETIKFATDVQ